MVEKNQNSNTSEETVRVRSNFACWKQFTEKIKQPILRGLIYNARLAAKNPYITVAISISVALIFATVGFFTNFVVETEGGVLWTPTGCNSLRHGDWIDSEESGFAEQARAMQVIVYAQGSNILGIEGLNHVFDVVDTVRSTPGYKELCALGRDNDDGECYINAATGFWENHNRSKFIEKVKSDDDAIYAMSHLTFANGEPVDRLFLFGKAEPVLSQNISSLVEGFSVSDILLESSTAYLSTILLPPVGEKALSYELEVTERLFGLEGTWNHRFPGNKYRIEVSTVRSFDDELTRGIAEDIPYMVIAFCIMGAFCSIALSKCHRIRSQGLLGAGAIFTIVLSLMTGYGLLFCIGIPFTSLTQVFPYVMVGIGLDDTFILTGSFARKDPKKDVVDRVEEVMEEVGISITASTLTTFVAFMLGGVASLPGIRWFAWYAGPTVLIDFFFQITFFIALIALDDRRQKASRRDFCPYLKAKPIDEIEEEALKIREETKVPYTTVLVECYSNILMKPLSKALVLVGFAILLVLGCIGASRQTQEFDFRDLTPADSFVRDYFNVLTDNIGGELGEASGNSFFRVGCYFRDINVAEPDNQEAMFKFIDDMVDLEYISSPPASFWLRDFLVFSNQTKDAQNPAFFDQLDVFLSTEPYSSLYGNDIVRDDNNYVTASRAFVQFDRISGYDQEGQIAALNAETEIAQKQPMNANVDVSEWHFFSLGVAYFTWELYGVIVQEILVTVLVGLTAVAIITLLFVPHPFGTLVVTPVVAMVYVELLAVLQIADLHINSVSAVGLTMSIGLVVDYNMHIVLSYFEIHDAATRDERVKRVLNTMGKSIMLGGFSTFLGVLPLCFSTSMVFRTFFVTFMGIVFLGVGHGLIFTPVILSLIAPHTPPVVLQGNDASEPHATGGVAARSEVSKSYDDNSSSDDDDDDDDNNGMQRSKEVNADSTDMMDAKSAWGSEYSA